MRIPPEPTEEELLGRRVLEKWSGEFGNQYTDRNLYAPERHTEFFRKLLEGKNISTILEVGSNIGINLESLNSLGYKAIGIEPNEYAVKKGIELGRPIVQGTGFHLPWPDETFDLVFTAGVLMHIPDANYKYVMSEIWRVSKKYALAIEYLSDEGEDTVTIKDYHGEDNMLWKRTSYQYPGTMIASGHAPEFDRAYYEMFRKDQVNRNGLNPSG